MARGEPIDLEDERLAPYRNLRTSSAPDPFVVEGFTAVERFVTSNWEVTSVVGTAESLDRLPDRVSPLSLELPSPALKQLVGFDFHRGALACGPRPPVARDARVLRGWAEEARCIVAVSGLADPANVGAIIRNARAFGADGALVDTVGADPLSRRAIRAAMGHVFTVPLVRAPLAEALPGLRAAGMTCLATHLHGEPLPQLAWPRRSVVVFGHEGGGLGPAVLDHADLRVRIPMDPAADSINVAAASAVILYAWAEATGQSFPK